MCRVVLRGEHPAWTGQPEYERIGPLIADGYGNAGEHRFIGVTVTTIV
jgi:hypothetical protein